MPRAVALARAQVIASDIHPLNNLRVLKYLTKDLGLNEQTKDRWIATWIAQGFEALEAMAGEECLSWRRYARDRRLLPRAADVQCAALRGAARSLSTARRDRRRMHETRRVPEGAPRRGQARVIRFMAGVAVLAMPAAAIAQQARDEEVGEGCCSLGQSQLPPEVIIVNGSGLLKSPASDAVQEFEPDFRCWCARREPSPRRGRDRPVPPLGWPFGAPDKPGRHAARAGRQRIEPRFSDAG